jgi:hypothetical protein
MNPVFWVTLPVVAAAVTGLLVYFIMRSRTEVLLSRQREQLAEARAALAAQKQGLEESLRHAEESARRHAMDEFLADIRIEERHYTREHRLLFLTKKSLIRQERIFFRNIPLSNWIEHEMPIEEGADADKLAQTMSVFAGDFLMTGIAGPAAPGPETLIRRVIR